MTLFPSKAAKLNGMGVFADSTTSGGYTFQVGADVGQNMVSSLNDFVITSADVGYAASAGSALTAVSNALESVAASRASIGAVPGAP